jgi:hypothetical protein
MAMVGCQGLSTGNMGNRGFGDSSVRSRAVEFGDSSVGPRAVEFGDSSVRPRTMKFGQLPAGTTTSRTGTLIAGGSPMTVSSAALDGTGFILSGISFPLIVPPRRSVSFTVTFVPEVEGRYSGSISFFSDVSNIPITQELTGTGLASSQHNVSLSWDPSTSTVAGYNIYRGSRSGGPYAKLNSSPQSATSFVDSMVRSGETYFYVTTSIDADSVESAYSNEAEVAIPVR